jgi:hypothetical protein
MYAAAVVGRKRRTAPEEMPPAPEEPGVADLNEVVAYNFRRTRELRGLTQEETAATLEGFLGHRLPQGSISAIERAYEGERRREFDAHEILMFACAFDLPLAWFFGCSGISVGRGDAMRMAEGLPPFLRAGG